MLTLDSNSHRHSESIRAYIKWVDPETARRWMSLNAGNRRIRKHEVRRLSAIMRRDEWVLVPDAIAFDSGGNLINGQHRLSAVIQADAEVPFLVVEGMPEVSRLHTDLGSARTFGDISHYAGVDLGSRRDQQIASAMARCGNKGFTARTNPKLVAAVSKVAKESIQWAGSLRPGKGSTSRAGIWCGLCLIHLLRPNLRKDLDSFGETLVGDRQRYDERDSLIFLLQDWLAARTQKGKNSGSGNMIEEAKMSQKVFLCWHERRILKHLRAANSWCVPPQELKVMVDDVDVEDLSSLELGE